MTEGESAVGSYPREKKQGFQIKLPAPLTELYLFGETEGRNVRKIKGQ